MEPSFLRFHYTPQLAWLSPGQPWEEEVLSTIFWPTLDYELHPFATRLNRRAVLLTEPDDISHDDLHYLLDPADLLSPDYPSDTFRGCKNNGLRNYGEYRTRRLVLEAWDKICGDEAAYSRRVEETQKWEP